VVPAESVTTLLSDPRRWQRRGKRKRQVFPEICLPAMPSCRSHSRLYILGEVHTPLSHFRSNCEGRVHDGFKWHRTILVLRHSLRRQKIQRKVLFMAVQMQKPIGLSLRTSLMRNSKQLSGRFGHITREQIRRCRGSKPLKFSTVTPSIPQIVTGLGVTLDYFANAQPATTSGTMA
jgi:hypothetical protein